MGLSSARFLSLSAAIVVSLCCQPVVAQHEGHKLPAAQPVSSPTPAPSPPKAASGDVPQPPVSIQPLPKTSPQTADEEMKPSGHVYMDHGLFVMDDDQMFIRVGLNESNLLPMGRMGSGTSWQPASTSMSMRHKQSGDWLLLFHYNFVAGINAQGGPRGIAKLESANWFMPSAVRRAGKGTLELRAMFSLEPFTFPRGGSPLLFQTGETYQGRPLIDRQHPHDLIMELSTTYTLPIGERGTWFAYAGYPGEPALGPTAFMHRASASENTSAPLSHHLQDSTHISFGVVTTGFTYRWFKLEGSVFNGREPGENRYNFEANPWNSRSVRLWFAPSSNWSMQVSHGFLRNPEALEPGDVRRTTASVSYNKPFQRGHWASSLIWGRNHESHGGELFNLNGYVAESTISFLDRNHLYTRLELTDKNQIQKATDQLRLGNAGDHPSFRIGAYTAGGAYDIWNTATTSLAVGSDVTLYSKPSILNSVYGDHPVSWKLFVRVRPNKMVMGEMH